MTTPKKKKSTKKKLRSPRTPRVAVQEFPLTYVGQELLEAGLEFEYAKGDYMHAMAKYEEALIQGHPGGALNLGIWYLEGTRPGVKKDMNKARHFLEIAAEEGLGDAQALIGRFHERGFAGYAPDPKRAWTYYKKAIKDPRVTSADPWIFAAICYERGVGIKKDSKKSISYFQKANKFPGKMYSYVMLKKYRPDEELPMEADRTLSNTVKL